MHNTIHNAAEKVWSTLGCGHSELIYQNALRIELAKQKGINNLSTGRVVPITYEGISIGSCVLDIDFMTEFGQMYILELKSIKSLRPEDRSQLKRYMRLFESVDKVGYLINFPASESMQPEVIEVID